MTGESAVPVLAIDGPGGSGKGTIGRILSQRLGWNYLDSGALYRAVGHAAMQAGVNPEDATALAELARKIDLDFDLTNGDQVRVLLNGADIGAALRTETAGEMASRVAAIPDVRSALLQKQRDFRQSPGLVADGRDMGTTVFPDAILKVFLTASPEIRAQRRYKQLKDKGFDANLPRLLGEIRNRDARDVTRTASPLKPAAQASILDTSELSISEVVRQIELLLRQRQSGS